MKTIIIVGGAGLLGREFVTQLKDERNIIVYDLLDLKAWNRLNTGVENYHSVDICSDKSLSEVISQTYTTEENIDCVINTSYPRNSNFGKNILDITLEDFNENIGLHLGGDFNVMQQFTKLFIKQGYGNIINIASIQGVSAPKFEHYKGTIMNSPVEYTAAKSAIIAISRYFAKYLKGNSIRVNCISPGGIFNNQPESFQEKYKDSCSNKGMLDPEDLCGAVKFLVSDESRYINGQNIVIDDGWSL